MDQSVIFWLQDMEASVKGKSLPESLFYTIKEDLMRSFRSDFNQIIEEFGFYQQLPPKFQNELTHTIFGKFMKKFSHILDECDQQFVNNMIVQLTYNFYEHG